MIPEITLEIIFIYKIRPKRLSPKIATVPASSSLRSSMQGCFNFWLRLFALIVYMKYFAKLFLHAMWFCKLFLVWVERKCSRPKLPLAREGDFWVRALFFMQLSKRTKFLSFFFTHIYLKITTFRCLGFLCKQLKYFSRSFYMP